MGTLMRSTAVASLLFLLLLGAARAEETPPTPPTPPRLEDPHRGRPTTPEAARVLETVKQRLASLKSYEMDVDVTYRQVAKGTKVHSHLAWLTPRFLMIESRFNADTSAKMVFDETWQWIERPEGPDRVTVLKIRLDKTTTAARPFDTFYYMKGIGLGQGSDYRETIRQMVTLYRFRVSRPETVDGTPCVVLDGSVDEAAMLSLDRGIARAPEVLRTHLLDLTRRSRLWVRADGIVVRGSMGSLEAFRDNKNLLVDYRAIKVDPPLTPQTFRFEPPAGATVQDITEEVIQARRQDGQ